MPRKRKYKKALLMLVTNDELELPLAVAETQTELVQLRHMSFKSIRRALKGEGRYKIIKIEMEDE